MESRQIERAQQLKAEGFSFRSIAEKLGVPLASVFRALKGKEESASEDLAEEAEQTANTTPVSRSLTNGERLRSILLAERIGETRAQLATIEAELAEIPQRKELLLAAEELDRHALTELEERGSQLAKEAELLRDRIPLLQNRQEGAEGEEAGERLHEIRAEAERLIEREGPALDAFNQALQALIERAQVVAELHAQHRDLCAEEVYLVERYRLPRLGVPSLKEIPNTAKCMEAVTRTFSLASGLNGQGHWEQKRRQWHAQRARGEGRAAASQPGNR